MAVDAERFDPLEGFDPKDIADALRRHVET
jgi:hypothetical protein